MRAYIRTVLAFLVIASLMVMVLMAVNLCAPRISNGDAIPADIAQRSYVLTGLVYDAELGGYRVRLRDIPPDSEIDMTLYFRIADILCGDQLLAQLSHKTTSQRTFSLRIPADEDGEAELLIRTSPATVSPSYSIRALFSRYTAQRPKIVISTALNRQRLSTAGNEFYRILMGAYVMLIVACLIMFRRKTTERYLLTVCTAAFFVLLYLLTTQESSLFPFSYGFASRMSAFTNILPVTCLAYTCIALFPEAIDERCARVFSLPMFVIVTAAGVAGDLLFGVYTYQLMRRLMLIPVLIVMARALSQRLRGSGLLFVAYSVMEGIAIFLYVSNSVLDFEYAPLLMFLRIKEISNLVFVGACAWQIFDRFSGKFLEADTLAAQVSALNVGLERMVEQRTRELRREQERTRGMMLNIFHDLRSPVFVLRGRLETMRASTPEDAQSLDVMRARVSYLERLIEDLFLLAKLEDGDIQYDQDVVDLCALARAVMRDMSAFAGERDVTLSGEIPSQPVATWGDGFRLQQAVVNLVENALLYTPQGGYVTLRVARAGERCLLSVTDTGKGISAQERERVFERYYRVNSRDKRSSGLGLSIAYEIVSNHLGSIRVDSEPGRGSVFTVDLPLFQEGAES